ncbi:cobalamin biosynthesis protein [Streptomyces roseicoloratus]|uniref:cobalamin biosynthesis protein n=1 Tax=Streptomyces roseicoloratus TaxID=2508722 RepID=UPI0035A6DD56
MASVGDALGRPAAEQRHEERAERDDYSHGPLLSDGGSSAHLGPVVVAGVGARSGVAVDEVLGLVGAALGEAGLTAGDLSALATLDARAAEPGIAGAAVRLGVPVRAFTSEELAGTAVPHPSAAPLAATGTASVAEAAALRGAGPGAVLLVPKRKTTRVTCAIARSVPLRPNEDSPGARLLSDTHGYIAGEPHSPPQAPPPSPPPTRRRPWTSTPLRTLPLTRTT